MNSAKRAARGLAAARLERLAEVVRREKAVRTEDLCARLGVSPATVRRDLERLEALGAIRRVHGGAVRADGRLEEPHFDDKTGLHAGEKERIAREALRRIQPDDTIYLDGGSTVLALARQLAGRTDLTVVTHSLRAAAELQAGGPRLILVGGELRRRSQTMVGPLTRCLLGELHVDRAFMGTLGLTPDAGMTTTDPAEAYTKDQVMKRAREVILLADASKLGKVMFARAGGLEDLDEVITDRGADRAAVRALKKKVKTTTV
jgi:DeoR family transcriptional regulator, fructose operon transcriptional repressor